jgi:hypothetical protein
MPAVRAAAAATRPDALRNSRREETLRFGWLIVDLSRDLNVFLLRAVCPLLDLYYTDSAAG